MQGICLFKWHFILSSQLFDILLGLKKIFKKISVLVFCWQNKERFSDLSFVVVVVGVFLFPFQTFFLPHTASIRDIKVTSCEMYICICSPCTFSSPYTRRDMKRWSPSPFEAPRHGRRPLPPLRHCHLLKGSLTFTCDSDTLNRPNKIPAPSS